MEAKELMIGDWIVYEGDTNYDNPIRIEGMDIATKSLITSDREDVGFDGIEPIPLTPEILEKNGLIKDEDRGKDFGQTYHILIPTGYEAHSFTVQVTIYKEPIQGVDVLFKCWGWIPPFNGALDDIHLCSLKYVHQIQHALRLCGIDKEIVL